MINHWYFGIILIVKQKESVYICLKPVLCTQIICGDVKIKIATPLQKKKEKKNYAGDLTPLKNPAEAVDMKKNSC